MSRLAMGVVVTVLSPNYTPGEIELDLVWTEADPLAIHLDFPADANPWLIARDLLSAGLALFQAGLDGVPVGPGDVTVIPWVDGTPHGEPVIEVVLTTPSGRCSLLFDPVDLDAFIESTSRRVTPGTEQVVPVDPAAGDREGEAQP